MVRAALSPVEVDEVWRRWRSGQAVKVLAREMRRNPSTVRDLLKRTGGIRPVPRRRWELRLSHLVLWYAAHYLHDEAHAHPGGRHVGALTSVPKLARLSIQPTGALRR
jgi:hypothetical protein